MGGGPGDWVHLRCLCLPQKGGKTLGFLTRGLGRVGIAQCLLCQCCGLHLGVHLPLRQTFGHGSQSQFLLGQFARQKSDRGLPPLHSSPQLFRVLFSPGEVRVCLPQVIPQGPLVVFDPLYARPLCIQGAEPVGQELLGLLQLQVPLLAHCRRVCGLGREPIGLLPPPIRVGQVLRSLGTVHSELLLPRSKPVLPLPERAFPAREAVGECTQFLFPFRLSHPPGREPLFLRPEGTFPRQQFLLLPLERVGLVVGLSGGSLASADSFLRLLHTLREGIFPRLQPRRGGAHHRRSRGDLLPGGRELLTKSPHLREMAGSPEVLPRELRHGWRHTTHAHGWGVNKVQK
eukprot:Hpha_TRINITY_DN9684_c0_g2::TRINITY_DN9684_c0_g2_i1::g.184261::m.184261